MSKKSILWANEIQIYGSTKLVLLAIAEITDEYGRAPISITVLAEKTNLRAHEVVMGLELLANLKIIAFLDGNNSYCPPPDILKPFCLYHCIFSLNVDPIEFTNNLHQVTPWAE